MLSAHQPRRIVLVSGSDTGDAEYLRLIDEVLQSQRDESLQIQRRVLDEPHIEVSMVALVSGLRMLFATGAAYGRKVAEQTGRASVGKGGVSTGRSRW